MANTTMENITCGNFIFYNNFDSANLARVEQVKTLETCDKNTFEPEGKSSKSSNSEDMFDYEFNLWTKHDCHGTQYHNNNRTWFYFGIKSCTPGISVKLNIVNLNKQIKMFSQGMCPVFKTVPGHLHWERIREKPTYTFDQKGNDFTLSFLYRMPENPKAITYFAFTYPFSYTDLQNYLKKIDTRMAKCIASCGDDIYYHRECAIKSLEGRRLDVLTISSYHNISMEREDRLNNMFPENYEDRSFKFWDKKIIFISARVHPGETPSSFVLNGFLNFILNREDQIALHLRRTYVFKLIPMLNPDGVAQGHYRMDTKGVNLNRVYLHPSENDHPTIYAARNLIRYYHNRYKLPEEGSHEEAHNINVQVTVMALNDKVTSNPEAKHECTLTRESLDVSHAIGVGQVPKQSEDSGLYLYIDLHGHASKKGVFMYGNYFDDPEDTITCMLLPKLMSINNPNFHFTSCNFAERNMYLVDKRDGMSREGSGRVAVYKMTGLVRSYTLECNYNSGRLVNKVPARVRDGVNKTASHVFVPPKYTPAVFEAVGAALGPSILDLTNNNPNSRLPNSQYRSLRGVKSYLKLTYVNNLSTSLNKPLHKDNNGIITQDAFSTKCQESNLNSESSDSAKDPIKSDINLIKKSCIIRRSTSFYSNVKRNTKGSKKPWQTKSQCINNIENNSIVCTIFKPSEYCHSKSLNAGYTNDNSKNHSKARKFINKKLDTLKNVSDRNVSSEEIAIIRHGAKRLKIISQKTRSEMGESSSSIPCESRKPIPRLIHLCNEQNTKGTFNKTKKYSVVNNCVKSKKPSKLQNKSRNDIGNGDIIHNETKVEIKVK